MSPIRSSPVRALCITAFLFIACEEPVATPEPVTAPPEAELAAFTLEADGPQIPFADLAIFFEYNATDDDLGVQVFLDADAWDRIGADSPNRRNILQFQSRNELGVLGLTELRFESAEPSPGRVLDLFRPGTYQFYGRTVDNERLTGTATLSHQLAPAPVFLAPEEDGEVDAEDTVIEWQPIAGLAGYEVIVANEDNGRSMTVELGPDATSLRVPVEFMEADAEYKVEVLAILPNGNKTITELTFSTE